MDSLALQRIPVLAVLIATTAGVVAQGGFYLPGRILVTVLAVAAFALAIREHRLRRGDAGLLLISAVAIAGWALLRAATAGGAATAAGICVTLATLVALVAVARRTGLQERVSLASGLVGLGVLVAVTGWAGVAWRIERWSVLVESTLWRASSALTYPNAATALLALALLLAEPAALWRAWAFYLLLAGLAATLSRAGALAFAAGVLVFAWFAPRRAVLRHLAPAVLGAAVALAGLVPSFPVDAQPDPLLAVCGLLVGGLMAVHLPKLRGGKLVAAWGLVLLASAGALAWLVSRPLPARSTYTARAATSR